MSDVVKKIKVRLESISKSDVLGTEWDENNFPIMITVARSWVCVYRHSLCHAWILTLKELFLFPIGDVLCLGDFHTNLNCLACAHYKKWFGLSCSYRKIIY